MSIENDTRACPYLGCVGLQRFTNMTARSGMAGWECSENVDHTELENLRRRRTDFTSPARLTRLDAILQDLQLIEHEVAGFGDAEKRDPLILRIRQLIRRVEGDGSNIA